MTPGFDDDADDAPRGADGFFFSLMLRHAQAFWRVSRAATDQEETRGDVVIVLDLAPCGRRAASCQEYTGRGAHAGSLPTAQLRLVRAAAGLVGGNHGVSEHPPDGQHAGALEHDGASCVAGLGGDNRSGLHDPGARGGVEAVAFLEVRPSHGGCGLALVAMASRKGVAQGGCEPLLLNLALPSSHGHLYLDETFNALAAGDVGHLDERLMIVLVHREEALANLDVGDAEVAARAVA